MNSKGSIELGLQAYIKILTDYLVTILILPPFKPSAMNFTSKNLVSKQTLLSYKRGGMLLLDLIPFLKIKIWLADSRTIL